MKKIYKINGKRVELLNVTTNLKFFGNIYHDSKTNTTTITYPEQKEGDIIKIM